MLQVEPTIAEGLKMFVKKNLHQYLLLNILFLFLITWIFSENLIAKNELTLESSGHFGGAVPGAVVKDNYVYVIQGYLVVVLDLTSATPAIVDNKIYVRTTGHLYAFGH